MNRGRLPDPAFWEGRKVLITGHTGFKGGWLTLMLNELGASVSGLSDRIPTDPSYFTVADVAGALNHDLRIDVRDAQSITATIQSLQPEIVFHLAAQPLVLEGARDPVGTFATNVMGTVNVLDACLRTPGVLACIVITTDKVYRPSVDEHGHREDDPLGGDEPYSASKVGAEMAAASYMTLAKDSGLQVVTCRAGNVIGGGDWSPWRLLPDLLAALDSGDEIQLRHPSAVRPWQHVIDPLTGYAVLAESLCGPGGHQLPRSWNFGPPSTDSRTVMDLVREVQECAGSPLKVTVLEESHPETPFLALSSGRAESELGWSPRWNFDASIDQTVRWHMEWRSGRDMAMKSRRFVQEQIKGSASV